MKKLNMILLLVSFMATEMAFALEGLDLGISVMTSKSDSTGDKYDVNGVLFMTYEGYDIGLNGHKSLEITPTNIEVSVNGKKVKAFTDIATLTYYGRENFEATISAISLDYNKSDNYLEREEEKFTYLDASVTKFIPVGSIDFDVTAALSVGGHIKANALIKENAFDISDSHYYTGELALGSNFPITDTLDLYVYGGVYEQVGKKYEKDGVYFGAELYGFEVGKGIIFTPSIEYKKSSHNYSYKEAAVENMFQNEGDSALFFQVKVSWF